jgi:hypothetical protein
VSGVSTVVCLCVGCARVMCGVRLICSSVHVTADWTRSLLVRGGAARRGKYIHFILHITIVCKHTKASECGRESVKALASQRTGEKCATTSARATPAAATLAKPCGKWTSSCSVSTSFHAEPSISTVMIWKLAGTRSRTETRGAASEGMAPAVVCSAASKRIDATTRGGDAPISEVTLIEKRPSDVGACATSMRSPCASQARGVPLHSVTDRVSGSSHTSIHLVSSGTIACDGVVYPPV